jgi:hypothetical protein
MILFLQVTYSSPSCQSFFAIFLLHIVGVALRWRLLRTGVIFSAEIKRVTILFSLSSMIVLPASILFSLLLIADATTLSSPSVNHS